MTIERIELELTEINGLIDVLLFAAENAEEADQLRLRDAAVALLYVVGDKLTRARREVTRCPCRRRAFEAPAGAG